MPEAATRWKDTCGQVHDTFDEAIVADITRLLGRVGHGDNSLTTAIARMIVEKRDTIRPLLRALDDHHAPMVMAAEPDEPEEPRFRQTTRRLRVA